jgi:tRNA modification GTPase
MSDDTIDTIAAIATAVVGAGGPGGVGIVRLSGPAAIAIAARVVGRALPPRRVVVATARDAAGTPLDQVIAFAMPGPASFTGEDVAELQGHAGAINLAALLDAVVAAGARVAGPGEFTRRAFAHGKLDLTQAEALLAVIEAGSARAHRVAQAQLRGELGQVVAAQHARLLAVLAEVEATIDFPDEDLGPSSEAWLHGELAAIEAEVRALASSYRAGRVLGAGLEVALVGAVNVGKSSLLNALVGQARALVAASPGTTRDVVEARASWDGVAVTLLDTAGRRDAEGGRALDPVEAAGIELGAARAAQADVVLLLADGAAPWPEPPAGAAAVLRVQTKLDLGAAPRAGACATSAVTGVGLAELRAAVLTLAGLGDAERADQHVVVSARQRELLEAAARGLAATRAALTAGTPTELAALDLRAAMDALAAVTGREVTEEMLDAMFARFCIGK